MESCNRVSHLQQMDALDSNIVVGTELEFMHQVEQYSHLKSLLFSDNQQLADACIEACHVTLHYCTCCEENIRLDTQVTQMVITVLEREVKILKTM